MPRAASFGFRKVLIVGVAVLVGGPTLAQPKVGQTPPVAAAQPSTADACYAGYGLNPAQKIKICSDVIDSGSVKGLGLGLTGSRRLVNEFEIESIVGVGTRVVITRWK